MPKDSRLYMTFPNDFWMHPKIAPLSDAAFRVFVEINGYSRMQDLDGKVPVRIAKRQWKARAIGELLENHPERPSLSLEGDNYIIWNYAEHQQTTADREKQSATNAANGAKGGRPKRQESDPVSNGNPTESDLEAKQKHSQRSESKSEIETDVTDLTESSHLPDSTAEGRDSKARSSAELLGIRDLVKVTEGFVRATKQPLNLLGSVELARAIISKAAGEIRDVDAYLATVCRKTPGEVRQAYDDLDIEGYTTLGVAS